MVNPHVADKIHTQEKKMRDSEFGNALVFHWYNSGKSMEDQ